jgi:hypothetical protein
MKVAAVGLVAAVAVASHYILKSRISFVRTTSALTGAKLGPVMAQLRITTAAIQALPSLQPSSADMRRKGASRVD